MTLGGNNLRVSVYQAPPLEESKVHPQMISSVYSVWYVDLGRGKKRTLFCRGKIKTQTLSIFWYLESKIGRKQL